MSFLSSAFSGASNNYSPGSGNAQQTQQITQDNQNLATANTGLNNLAGMLTQQAQGTGPNLANAQLQSATAQNVGNQAALMAGQRGASANPALIARQAAQQGANIQQQAAGQSAQNVLAQQIAAQQQLGNVYGTQGSLANQNYSAVQGGVNANNAIGSEQGRQNAGMNQGLMGGLSNAVGSITGLFADGGQVQQNAIPGFGSGSNFGFNFTNMKTPTKSPGTDQATLNQMNAGIPSGSMDVLESTKPMVMGVGQVNSMPMAASGGYIKNYASGGPILPFMPVNLTQGGPVKARVPEEKAVKSGNSYANDKIPAMVSEDEVVLPRNITTSPNAPHLAAQFMQQVMQGKHKVRK